MISQTAEYALRAVVFLAEKKGAPQTTEQIAQGMQIPAGYLSKVLQMLRRAKLVRSRRGLGGGFVLAGKTGDHSLLDVVNAVDPIRRITECPLGRRAPGKKLCSLHERLDAALALIEDAFRTCTLEDLCKEEGLNPPFCTVGSGHGER